MDIIHISPEKPLPREEGLMVGEGGLGVGKIGSRSLGVEGFDEICHSNVTGLQGVVTRCVCVNL